MNKLEFENMIQRCLRCSICKWIPQVQIKSKDYATICPSVDMYNFHAYSGGGKIILALSLYMNRLTPDNHIRDIVYKCTQCGGCDISCKFLNSLEPLEIIRKLREDLVEQGIGPLPGQVNYISSVQRNKNPYNEASQKRLDWLTDDIKTSKDSDILFFVGCTSSYRRKEIARATAKILNYAGIQFQLLGTEELCCGSPVLRAGDKQNFLNVAKKNLELIKSMGIQKIIFCCAGCYSTFKCDYFSEYGYDFEVIHVVELFEQLIDEKKLRFKDKPIFNVTYHDPCHLGRLSERDIKWKGDEVPIMPLVTLNVPPQPKKTGSQGVYESPRRIITKIPGVNLIEMERIKEYSYCCGAGAGVKSAYPDFALHTAMNRISEAEDTKAEYLISSCPFCASNLQDAIKTSKSNLKFLDISELILMKIEEEE